MLNMQSISQSPHESNQPPLPCMAEYMARNEYGLREPEVIDELFRQAKRGEAWAQYSAGKLCFEGIIVPPDEDGSEKWWRLAAEQGHSMAQRWLGEFYTSRQIKGFETNAAGQDALGRDIEQAKIWLGNAALQGVVEAMGMRGSLESDPVRAIEWYRMGAEHGDVDCMYVLGEIYAEGSRSAQADKAVRLDADRGLKAVKWFRLAAESGHEGAAVRLGLLYEKGEIVAQDYMEAARWYRVGADKEHRGCHYLLGAMYVDGRGVPKDYTEAERWLDRAGFFVPGTFELLDRIGVYERDSRKWRQETFAKYAETIAHLMPKAESGAVDALYELGEIYRSKCYMTDAVEWHWRAACQGHVDSKLILMEIFDHYYWNNVHYEDAKKWGKELAENGNARAQYLWATFCDAPWDEYFPKNYKHWVSKAAEQGLPTAQYMLAAACGVDQQEAFRLFLQAAKTGHKGAQMRVAECYLKGKGVQADLDAALEWALKAVKTSQNKGETEWADPDDQVLLGNVYEAFNTPKDDLSAVACYRTAATRHRDEAYAALGRMYEFGRGVEQDYSEALKLYMEALNWDLGYHGTHDILFSQLSRNIRWYVDKDLEGCKRDAERGDANAQVEYGFRIYRWNNWDPENDAEVLKWFRLSAEHGHPLGQYCQGHIICSASRSWGHPVAMRLFRDAARSGLAEAQSAIAQYYRGRSDYAVAVRWFRMAAGQGEYSAMLALGEMCFKGTGVPQDNVEAANWFRRALDRDEEAWAKRTWSLLGRNLHETESGQIVEIP